MFKILSILILTGVVVGASKAAKSNPFEIGITALWDEKSAVITIKHKGTMILSTPVSMNSNSADSFGKMYDGHTIRLTRNKSKNIYLVEIYFEGKLNGGNIIDFNANKVINIT
jgi:hypothetical protein